MPKSSFCACYSEYANYLQVLHTLDVARFLWVKASETGVSIAPRATPLTTSTDTKKLENVD